jgi:hypothetical protein
MANTVALPARQLGVIDKRTRRVGLGPGGSRRRLGQPGRQDSVAAIPHGVARGISLHEMWAGLSFGRP